MHSFYIFVWSLIVSSAKNIELEWVMSKNISSWYTPFDLCMLEYNSSTVSIDEMMGACSQKVKQGEILPPLRCRAGNYFNY